MIKSHEKQKLWGSFAFLGISDNKILQFLILII